MSGKWIKITFFCRCWANENEKADKLIGMCKIVTILNAKVRKYGKIRNAHTHFIYIF